MSLKDLFEGKSVIVVGPAQCVLKDCENLSVDSYDVVCRLNDHCRKQLKYSDQLGERTDVLYLAFQESQYNRSDIIEWKRKSIKVFGRENFNFNKREYWNIQNKDLGFEFTHLHSYLHKLKGKMKVNPSTGVLATFHALDCGAASVTCVGFDFYQSLYLDDDNEEWREKIIGGLGNHNPKKQFKKFAEMVRNEERFIPVGKLKSLLDDFYNQE